MLWRRKKDAKILCAAWESRKLEKNDNILVSEAQSGHALIAETINENLFQM